MELLQSSVKEVSFQCKQHRIWSKESKVKVTINFNTTSIRLTKIVKSKVKQILLRPFPSENIKNEHTNDSVPSRPPGRISNFRVRRCLVLLPQLLCNTYNSTSSKSHGNFCFNTTSVKFFMSQLLLYDFPRNKLTTWREQLGLKFPPTLVKHGLVERELSIWW